MSPQQLQALQILQETTLELQQRITTELSVNPLLEVMDIGLEQLAGNPLEDSGLGSQNEEHAAQLAEYDESMVEAVREIGDEGLFRDALAGMAYDEDAEERRRHFFNSLSSEATLQERLLRQLGDVVQYDPYWLRVCTEVLGNLDDAGYLQASDEDIARGADVSLADAQRAVAVVQSLEPAGIGARDLRECLLLQLERNREQGSIAWDIVDQHLDDLARNRLPQLAKSLDVELSEVQEAVERIRSLDPRPGHALAATPVNYIVPEAIIERGQDGQWQVRMNRWTTPRLGLAQRYVDMLQEPSVSAEVKQFIRERMASAKTLMNALGERQSTIERIAWVLVEKQEDFLREGAGKLRPLTMRQVAEELELHETTISRAVANKYVQTPHGLFSFRHFFTTGYESSDGEALSSHAIKEKIAALIAQETKSKPLSDQKIADLLAKDGLTVARRTVAKYREEEGIPAASLRRVHS
ncbi:MAG: RNA polymerase factor sigma-54 [Lentisphaerae bacterium]|nr:RNA polymerase factor sigma-54 [Lentisphaerota bacterium]